MQYLNQYAIIKSSQHGFQRERCAEPTAVDFAEHVNKNLDLGKRIAKKEAGKMTMNVAFY